MDLGFIIWFTIGHWYADMGTLTGTSITIDGVTCTYTFVGAAITKNELITLLENHPSGVCVCGHRSTRWWTRYSYF